MKTISGLLMILLLTASVTRAQGPGTNIPNASRVKDSIIALTDKSLAPPKRAFPVKMLIVPATLITYGITSISNGELKEVNQEVKEELWLENAHKQVHLDNYLQWAPAAAVYGLNALGIKGAHNFRDRTIIYGLSTLIMSSSVYAVKNLSKQWRPDGSDQLSFPSGHTANAFAAAEFLRREYKDVSPWYGIAGYAVAATTGYLRMYNNKHWLGDVVAGAGVGILSTDLAYYLYPTVRKLFVKEKGKATIAAPFYNQGVVGLSVVHQF